MPSGPTDRRNICHFTPLLAEFSPLGEQRRFVLGTSDVSGGPRSRIYPPTVDDISRVFAALHPTVTVVDAVASAVFEPQPEHRGNPGFLHGGMAATVLDHLCARTASAALGGVRVVTGTLDLRYPLPVPIEAGPYQLWAEHDSARGRTVRVRGAILSPDGKPMVEAKAMFLAM